MRKTGLLLVFLLLIIPLFLLSIIVPVNASAPWDSGGVLINEGISLERHVSQYVSITYTALQDIRCDKIVVSNTSIVFFFGSNQWSIDSLVPYNLFSVITEYNYPDPDPDIDTSLGDLFPQFKFVDSSSASGYLTQNGSDYDTVRSSYNAFDLTNRTNGGVSPFMMIGQSNYTYIFSYEEYYINRGYLYFDLSSIPRNVEVINATLYLFAELGEKLYDNNYEFIVQDGQPSRPSNNLGLSDYNQAYYSGNHGNLSIADLVPNAYNPISLSPSIINVGGLTKLCVRLDNDINGAWLSDNELYYYEGWTFENYGDRIPILEVWYSADAEIIAKVSGIPTGIYVPIYIDDVFIGYASSLNDYTIIYPIQPNNVTTHPVYRVRFGDVHGYVSPSTVEVTLGYGNIKVITGTYYEYTAYLQLIEFSTYIQVLMIVLVTGLFAFLGKVIGNRINIESNVPWMVGAVSGLIICAASDIMPILWLFIFSVVASISVYLWWRRR